MKQNRFRRYQLNKKSSIQVRNEHPWVFTGNLSSAASVYRSGQWLKLFDGENKVLGYGIYSGDTRIGIRVFHFGETVRNRFFFKKLREVIKKKEKLLTETDGIRWLNGESDGFPGITVDQYNNYLIIQYYSPSLYGLARLVSFLMNYVLEKRPSNILVKSATKIGLQSDRGLRPPRWTRGKAPSDPVTVFEGAYSYLVDLESGQKGGFFLDLRGSRRVLSKLDLTGMRVLNLFSYTGAFSVIALQRGASEVVSVDQSRQAQETHRKNLSLNGLDDGRDRLVCSDVFRFLANLDDKDKFDLIIIDPPCMASKMTQVPMALKKLEQLHYLALTHIKEESLWFSISCTARFTYEDLVSSVGKASKSIFGKGRTQIAEVIAEEVDHSINKYFPEGRYLNQVLFANFRLKTKG